MGRLSEPFQDTASHSHLGKLILPKEVTGWLFLVKQARSWVILDRVAGVKDKMSVGDVISIM
jgi:hypothetical protein